MSLPTVVFDRTVASQNTSRSPAQDVEPTTFAPVSSAGLPITLVPKLLAAAEASAVLIAAVLAKVAYLDLYLESHPPILAYALIALAMVGMLYSVYKQMGLYDLDTLAGPEIRVGKVVAGLVIALLVLLGSLYAIKEVGDLSRGWVFSWTCLIAVFVIPIRFAVVRRVRRGMETGLLLQRIAIIGTTDFALFLASRIRELEGRSGAIDLFHSGSAPKDVRFVGELGDLEATMAVRPYDRVVVAVPGGDIETVRTIVKSLGSYTTELLLCTDLTQMPVFTNGARQLAGIRADVVNIVPLSEKSALLKSTFDLIVAAVALTALSPFFLLIAVAIKLDSRGPVFFRQRRLGQNRNVFRIYKFRSMSVEEDGPVITQVSQNDQRVTRVGRILRATSIDELPQLINVVLGQMSLVGPRPHALAHDQEFDRQFDMFSRRRRVKPGITGWAQVNGFRGETRTPEDVRGRMEHDLYYIDHWSIWFDIEILIRTMFAIARGAY